ncbi:hypothetical protein LJC00_03965 [Dysgonomonas sp. OttesenSCG-928-M03]|nr:hypothetical protein [Dysgonomonas sp. OttesenSCG-928-M03]
MQVTLFIAIGLLVGFVAERKLKKIGLNLVICIIIATTGSLVGGLIIRNLDFTSLHDQVVLSIISSFAGSLIMIFLGYLIKIND